MCRVLVITFAQCMCGGVFLLFTRSYRFLLLFITKNTLHKPIFEKLISFPNRNCVFEMPKNQNTKGDISFVNADWLWLSRKPDGWFNQSGVWVKNFEYFSYSISKPKLFVWNAKISNHLINVTKHDYKGHLGAGSNKVVFAWKKRIAACKWQIIIMALILIFAKSLR